MEPLIISRLAHLGDGVADTPQGPVFAPFTLPGEAVTGRIDDGRLPEPQVLTPSPDRVAPVCPHFGVCGGCALQHASDGFLADWKTQMVAAALAARGLSAPLRLIAVSPPGTRRRVTFAGRRTRKTVVAGFHGRSDATLIAITACAVAHPAIVAALPVCAALVGLTASRSGEVRLSVTVTEGGLDIDLAGQKPLDGPLRALLAQAAAAADMARLSYGGETVAQRRPPHQRFGRALVAPPPGGFLQATREGEAALLAAVAEAVGDAATVADLFSGSGTFALPLAERAAVRAVEADAAALAALDAAWRATPGLRAVAVETRDLKARPLMAAELNRFDAVVFDPPRAGAAAQAAQIAGSAVSRVAAVSCNPATFARDARTLIDGGYRLDWVQPVDQFRWSPHVELVGAFTKA